ncbi:hypothetical protein RE428_30030 [Marinobacter nanhaiticus D15-8W]|uniref:Uncharacterized protein n=1 Tax=Marinobacter nanhaiticus D15-8W TaxID=626887 RepID=N6W9S0_9GAMM|nr:DUF6586 family protein [Marinobacter nanhaiticus]ENO17019.1 hypothetical protein J057_01229 [Marinobacter nanhaiticus D15-8W]BES71985.1 hypothetical protein RE428_30030 [Marinobacter nanhaiticus D15-8W]
MASQWPSFTKQQVFLATTLIRVAERQAQAAEREAATQGAVALLIEARTALLRLVADIYQVRNAAPRGLDELADLLAGDQAELNELRSLAADPGSWWQHIEFMVQAQQRPSERKSPAERENMIAVAADSGPDRSVAALLETAKALKHYVEMILERHDEW